MVAQTGQPYAYTGDDPVNGTDPLGLCSTQGSFLVPGACDFSSKSWVSQTESTLQGQKGGGFSITNGLKAVADYGAAVGNVVTSTVTLGHVQIAAPYCGFGWASDAGTIFGTLALGVLGGGAGAAGEVADGTATVEEVEAGAQAGTRLPELAAPDTVNNAAAPIRSFVTSDDLTFVRVFSGENSVGGFLAGSAPESADAAVAGFALPPENTADLIQDVLVPAGTRLQSSIAGAAFSQPGGLLQFELLDDIPVKNFGPGVPFR
jgi:hypothetical protein